MKELGVWALANEPPYVLLYGFAAALQAGKFRPRHLWREGVPGHGQGAHACQQLDGREVCAKVAGFLGAFDPGEIFLV